MKYLLFIAALFLPACTCGVKIDSKPSDPASTEAADDERKIQAIVAKFSHEEITNMWVDAYKAVRDGKDNRSESIKNETLLFEAEKRTRPKPDLTKADVVNEKLKGL